MGLIYQRLTEENEVYSQYICTACYLPLLSSFIVCHKYHVIYTRGSDRPDAAEDPPRRWQSGHIECGAVVVKTVGSFSPQWAGRYRNWQLSQTV